MNETATLDDLSYEYMKEYLISTNAREDIRNQSKLDMAKSMGLISESEYGGYRAKNFAVLMFTEKPDKFIPYAHVEIVREAIGTDKMEAKIFDGPIWIHKYCLPCKHCLPLPRYPSLPWWGIPSPAWKSRKQVPLPW